MIAVVVFTFLFVKVSLFYYFRQKHFTMTENEFLIEYTKRFSKIVDDYIKEIKNNKHLHYTF